MLNIRLWQEVAYQEEGPILNLFYVRTWGMTRKSVFCYPGMKAERGRIFACD